MADPLRLETQDITVQCRANRGNEGAWDEAVERLRQVYDAQVKRYGPVMVLHLSIARSRAPGIPDHVYDAANALDGRYDACARCDHTREFHDFGSDIPSPWCFVDDCDCEAWLDALKSNDAAPPVAPSPVGGEQP